jgi:bifunctional NMN adenylyltransferase/nudix hydrolase
MKYDYAVIIGRMQPYHKAHHNLVNHALSIADKVIIVLGSARKSPDVKNPFTLVRRERMVRACFPNEVQPRLMFQGVRDYPYNENYWIAEVQNSVSICIEETSDLVFTENEVQNAEKLANVKVALVGFFKDETSYYLNHFPQWKFEEFYQNNTTSKILNGTDVRELFFKEEDRWEDFVLDPVKNQMREFRLTSTYKTLKKEFDYIQKYKQDSKFVGLPYAPTFVTTDAVTVCMGHILVVRRGSQPGKGLLGLPGGFLADGLRLEDNMLKELKEETNIHVDKAILRGSIKDKEVFDYPLRSLRGRTVTHAYHLELQPSLNKGLPLVRGGDDASKAFWLPISSLSASEEEFFEDHIHIIRHFLGLV